MCSQIVKTSSVQRLLLVTSNSAHESDILGSTREGHFSATRFAVRTDVFGPFSYVGFFFNTLQPRSSPFRLFYRGVHCTLGEHVVTPQVLGSSHSDPDSTCSVFLNYILKLVTKLCIQTQSQKCVAGSWSKRLGAHRGPLELMGHS